MNKIVRDLIPVIIEDSGRTPIFRQLTGEELNRALAAKLVEESREALEAVLDGESIDRVAEELADLSEVIEALRVAMVLENKIDENRKEKGLSKGNFYEGVYLESIEDTKADFEAQNELFKNTVVFKAEVK